MAADTAADARLAWRLTRRERRGSARAFLIAGTAMAIAVAILSIVLGVADSMRAAVDDDTKSLIGGDLELELVTRDYKEEEVAWLGGNTAAHSLADTTRAIARTPDDQQLVYLKAVDERYPLIGELELEEGSYSHAMLEPEGGGAFPAVVSPDLRELLGLELGSALTVGNAPLTVAAFIAREPDPNTRVWVTAPPVIISHEAFLASNLDQPGSIVRRRMRILFPEGVGEKEWRDRLGAAFPGANWEIETHKSALRRFSRVVGRLETFLSLASLGTILIAGIGIGNTVSTFLRTRIGTIATLKTLGATARLVRWIYLIQVCLICVFGALAGALLGGAATRALVPALSERLPMDVVAVISPATMLAAVLCSLMSALVFALPPLHRFSLTNPTLLFNSTTVAAAYEPATMPAKAWAGPAAIAALLVALLFLTAADKRVFYWTVVGIALALALFGILARLLSAWAGRFTRGPLPVRLALRNVSRVPVQLRMGMVSFGVALTSMTALLLTQANLDDQLGGDLREKSPDFYMVGIQPFQRAQLAEFTLGFGEGSRMILLPFIRGRITHMAGVPTEEIEPPDEYHWVLDNDRGITWIEREDEEPSVSTAASLVPGEWRDSLTPGAPLEVSFDGGAAEAFGIGAGDTIALSIDDRQFEAEITDLRPINWRDLRINFVMVFSENKWKDIPTGYLGGAHLPPGADNRYQKEVSEQFPNVTLISTKDIFATAERLIGNVNAIINTITLVAVLTGLLVIGTTIVEGQQMRTVQAVIMRVLGASRSRLTAVFCIEFVVMAGLAMLPAILLGSVCAFFVITRLFELEWGMDFGAAGLIAGAMVAVSLVAGIVSMRSSLMQPPLKYLRND